MGCSKCGCSEFRWNPLSALVKFLNFPDDNYHPHHAYRNCVCGHQQNYHY